ncbi:MAG: hypothetical protein ACM3KL_00385 [Alphaproteobacteria bacterium]
MKPVNAKSATVFALFLTGLIGAQGASPFKTLSGNRLLHTPSNIVFPGKVGLFERADSYNQIYGSQGRDVSVRYLLDSLIICEAYVYPVGTYGGDLTSEFKIQQDAIQQMNKKARRMSQKKVHVIQNGRSVSGLYATYQLTRHLFTGRDERCGSQLFVFRDGPWFVAYRFSYPVERSDIANKHVGDFLHQWQWRV